MFQGLSLYRSRTLNFVRLNSSPKLYAYFVRSLFPFLFLLFSPHFQYLSYFVLFHCELLLLFITLYKPTAIGQAIIV